MKERRKAVRRFPFHSVDKAIIWGVSALSLVVYLAYFLTYVCGVSLFDGRYPGGDFSALWAAVHLALKDGLTAVYDPALFQEFRESFFAHAPESLVFPYPPQALLFLLPLALLPFGAAFFLWEGVTFALYAWVANGRRFSWFLWGLLLLAPATVVTITAGQNGFLSALFLIGGAASLKKRPFVAGVLFGCLVFKPHLALLIPVIVVATREWRLLCGGVLSSCVITGLSWLLFGTESFVAYVDFMQSFGAVLSASPENAPGYVRMVSPFMGLRHLGLPVWAAWSGQGLFTLFAAWAVYTVYREGKDDGLRRAVFYVAVFLATPYAFVYDLPLLALAVIRAAGHAVKEDFLPGEKFLLISVWLLPFFAPTLNKAGLGVSPFILGLLLTVLVRHIHHQKRA